MRSECPGCGRPLGYIGLCDACLAACEEREQFEQCEQHELRSAAEPGGGDQPARFVIVVRTPTGSTIEVLWSDCARILAAYDDTALIERLETVIESSGRVDLGVAAPASLDRLPFVAGQRWESCPIELNQTDLHALTPYLTVLAAAGQALVHCAVCNAYVSPRSLLIALALPASGDGVGIDNGAGTGADVEDPVDASDRVPECGSRACSIRCAYGHPIVSSPPPHSEA